MAVEVGEAYISILPSARGFAGKLSGLISGDMDAVGNDAGERAGASFLGSFGGKLKLAGAAIAAAVGAAAVGAGVLVGKSISAASDLNEVISKSNSVFGDSAKEIEAWAGTAATSLGQSKTQALGAASQFGNMFKQLGIGGPQVATMSKQMVELASDFASFHNADITEVIEAQQAAFRGEYDSVQKFVPTITAAAVEQKALALGLKSTTKELTAQDKALATQALLLEGAGDAMGDFTRTSAGFANQQRIMSAQWDNLKASIGQGFLPAASAAAQVVTSKLMPALQGFVANVGPKVGTAIAEFTTAMFGLGPAADTAFGRAGQAVYNFTGTALHNISGFVRDGLGAMRELVDAFRNGIDIPGSPFDNIGRAARNAWEAIKEAVAEIKQTLAGAFDGLSDVNIRAFFQAFKDGGDDITSSGINGKLEELGQKVRTVVDKLIELGTWIENHRDLFDAIVVGITTAATALLTLHQASKGISLLNSGFQIAAALLPLLLSPIGLIALAIGALAAGAFFAYKNIEPFREAVDRVFKAFKEGGFKEGIQQAAEEFGKFWGYIRPKLVDLLANIGTWIKDTGVPWLKDRLTEWGQAFGDWVTDTAWPFLRDKLPVLLGNLAGWIRDTGLPWLEQQLIEWGKAFGDWVQNTAVPTLKEKLPGIISAIEEFIRGTVLPQIGILARNIGAELLKFAGETAQRMPGELAKIAIQIFLWMAETALRLPAQAVGMGLAILKGLAQGLWEGTKDVISFLAELGGNILQWLGDQSTLLVNKGIEVLRGFWNGLQDFVGEVVSFFASLPGKILGWLGDVTSTLRSKGSDILRGFWNGLQDLIGDVVSFFASLPGKILGWLGDVGSLLYNKGGDVIRGFIDGLKSWFGSIAGNIANIASVVSNAIGDAGGWLYGVGQDVIRGLINGIKSMAGAAASAAREAVSAAINAAKGVLGIGSPSKVFAAIGVNVGEGFVLGVEKTEGMIRKAVWNQYGYLESLPGVSSGMTGVSLAANAGRQLVNVGAPVSVPAGAQNSITVNAQTNADPHQVARELSWVLLTRGR